MDMARVLRALHEVDYDGVIERDGWAPYRSFKKATAQSCLAHLLRRCSGLIDARVRGYSTVPTILKEILTDALVLRGRRDGGEITPEELGVAVAGLDTRLKALLARRGHTVENRKLLKHLGKENDPQLELAMNTSTFASMIGVATSAVDNPRSFCRCVANSALIE